MAKYCLFPNIANHRYFIPWIVVVLNYSKVAFKDHRYFTENGKKPFELLWTPLIIFRTRTKTKLYGNVFTLYIYIH